MLKRLLYGALFLCAAGFTNAATITLTDTVAVSKTNYQQTLSFAKFDTMGGTRALDSVTFSIDGSIFGSAEVESRDALPTTIITMLSAELMLIDSLMNTLVVTIPGISNTFNAGAYDGSLDFGGSSGITYPDLTANKYEEATYTDAPTLAMFTGMDMASFTFDAQATSSSTGAGNITTRFASTAGALVSIVYSYTDTSIVVSAPTHVAVLGLGLLGIAGLRKVRK